MWDRIRDWLDNPIFVKHLRSRLRPQPVFSSLVVVVLLNLCLAYAGYELDSYKTGAIAGWIVAIQVVILTVMGAGQVNASVNGARASGILDFHRVSPMTPTELTLGFFFGAPIREYALFAATIPFTVLCMAFGVPSFRGFLQLMIIIVTSSWMIHGLMLLNGLMSRAKAPSGGAVGIIVFLFFFFGFIFTGAQFSVNVAENDHRLNFFGVSLPWLPVALLYQMPVLFFLLLAATRKMESQRLHPLSKPQAIVAMLTFATLVLGGIWKLEGYEVYEVAALYLLAVPAILLTIMITPSQAEYAKGLYRAQKQGRTRLFWWDDLSVNWISLAILAAIVLGAGTIAGTAATGSSEPWIASRGTGSYPLALAAAVLTVAYFGLALQYFQFRFARRGAMYFGLFLFIFWILPLLAGSIQSMAFGPMRSGEGGYPLFALSPVAGIGLIASVSDPALAYPVQASTLTPILLFTFVFNYLLVGARRRVMKSVFTATDERKQQEVELEVVEPAAEGARE
jgi:hypothetical protein